MLVRPIRLLAVAGTLLLAAPYAPSWAQSVGGAAKRIESACRAESARLCPALSDKTPTPRDRMICLRPYKTSLSFGCRAAVNGMAHAAETSRAGS